MALVWDDTDPTASVAQGRIARYVVWRDGTLSGHGRTTRHETVFAAKVAAEAHDKDCAR